ncbi:ABC transporter permease subunit, partial [Clostridioides difficile]|nr:ABC transporter permease subunit [Clostridioides difficile]NJB05643.1 ABC transporter permease subunit [Clostridioides difficile]
LLVGKLIAVGGITVLLSLFSFLCTFILGLLFCNINISVTLVVKSLVQILSVNLYCYVAVLPIIAYFGRKQNAFLTGVGIAFVYG